MRCQGELAVVCSAFHVPSVAGESEHKRAGATAVEIQTLFRPLPEDCGFFVLERLPAEQARGDAVSHGGIELIIGQDNCHAGTLSTWVGTSRESRPKRADSGR